MIYTIIGTRPNILKIDPELPQTIISTGQHYSKNMHDNFFNKLKLPKPKYNLGLTDTGEMITELRKILKKDKPSMVVIFGDTNSSLAGAMAAYYENIPVAHIESGLRSGDETMPEEKNRIVIDRISKLKFCHASYAVSNLLKEGINEHVYVVGDPLFDTLGKFLPIKKSTKNYKKYILLTVHRDFNADNKENLNNIFGALGNTGEKYIFPCHPRTKKNLKKFKITIPDNIKVIAPQNYDKMLYLISNAKKVITDSGGVQREAFWFNVPVIILRESTEWKEITSKGSGVCVGTDVRKIQEAVFSFNGSISAPPQFGVNKKIREIIFKNI